jgi:chemotaxis protein MotB
MAPDEEQVPIRIVRKKGGHAGHHGGAWKVAYADFVTAMMALFIVLWIVGQSKAVKESISGYFKDPGAFSATHKGGAGTLEGGLTPIEQPGISAIEQQQERLKKLGEQIMKDIGSRPELAAIAGQVRLELVDEGLRIEIVEKSESFFFDVGTSEIKPGAASILTVIAGEVGHLTNRLAVEGHTDSRQYTRQDGYTNFELSAERANSARRILVRGGVAPTQIDEVRGYADTHLRNREDPLDLTNRRISVLIKFKRP